jgi:hypothetical protein
VVSSIGLAVPHRARLFPLSSIWVRENEVDGDAHRRGLKVTIKHSDNRVLHEHLPVAECSQLVIYRLTESASVGLRKASPHQQFVQLGYLGRREARSVLKRDFPHNRVAWAARCSMCCDGHTSTNKHEREKQRQHSRMIVPNALCSVNRDYL